MFISSLFSYHLQCRCLQEEHSKIVFGAPLEHLYAFDFLLHKKQSFYFSFSTAFRLSLLHNCSLYFFLKYCFNRL